MGSDVRAIFEYDLCIAVLTYANPNVYYELAVAQSASRPVLVMIEKGNTLPFDVKDMRTLNYDLTITSYKNKTHVTGLKKFLERLRPEELEGRRCVSVISSETAGIGRVGRPGVRRQDHLSTPGEVVDKMTVEVSSSPCSDRI